jgi:hypothetical protein
MSFTVTSILAKGTGAHGFRTDLVELSSITTEGFETLLKTYDQRIKLVESMTKSWDTALTSEERGKRLYDSFGTQRAKDSPHTTLKRAVWVSMLFSLWL